MKVCVPLKTTPYTITFCKGGLSTIGGWLSDIWEPQRVAIITDKTVSNLYLECVSVSLKKAGFEVSHFAIEPGEASKSLQMAEVLFHWLAEEGLTRSDGIIALGGGVVGDLAGFVASTYMRGIHFVQVPTTLLAQVDSSVGGKTAVNTAVAKNLVGSFAQPSGVFIDTTTLHTLSERRVKEGLAEIIKTAAILDAKLWETLSGFDSLADFLKESDAVIARCCELKASVVLEDEFDNGKRLILNFGHTIGHAIEATSGYGVVTHGEAVALGMVQISQRAEDKELIPKGLTRDIKKMLIKFGLNTHIDKWDEEALLEAIAHDKKKRGNTLKLILLETIGEAKIVTLPIEEIASFLKRLD
ncbi:3-dehydroquinate synthase [Vagococcus sp. PNs007]|uniref:3-dehydroquinate synthase n=1 Tax=Vagococcus proximus TaxID=2991417 RepID=A0ABT5WZA4_9ENTE|nr:3-dehydroquinate synthase [Vagococcus proximus]MDF0479090.1 3-dehydroquinate synthase [Vagococcus proximus]